MPRTPRDIETELLVLGAQSGDASALRGLIERCHGPLVAHARRCGGGEGAEDAVQEAWAQIAGSLRRLRDPAAFRAWAFRIVTRRVADHARAESRARRPSPAPPAPLTGPPNEDSVGLHDAIAALPPEQELTVRLHYGEGFSTRQIGRILGVPSNTVKSRLALARARLAAALTDEPDKQGVSYEHAR